MGRWAGWDQCGELWQPRPACLPSDPATCLTCYQDEFKPRLIETLTGRIKVPADAQVNVLLLIHNS